MATGTNGIATVNDLTSGKGLSSPVGTGFTSSQCPTKEVILSMGGIVLNTYGTNQLVKYSDVTKSSDYPIDLSVQSYEWFYTGTGASIYLQATGTVMGSIGVLPAGSSLNYRLVFKVGKRLILTPSNTKIQFRNGSTWMDLPVYSINGDTYADLSTGDTAILAGSSQAFNTLIRGKTNPTAPGSYLDSTIRIIHSGAIIGSVNIRYMKTGN